MKERESNLIEEPTNLFWKMEQFQIKVLKRLIACPKSTPPALLRLLTGTLTLIGRRGVHNRVCSYFFSVRQL